MLGLALGLSACADQGAEQPPADTQQQPAAAVDMQTLDALLDGRRAHAARARSDSGPAGARARGLSFASGLEPGDRERFVALPAVAAMLEVGC